ncbi:MAG: SAF domain-containing protein [Acidimicrobiaceae bacterium]|nr:SAF domain-containing protein [Acidimicrobiaceae bacterium]
MFELGRPPIAALRATIGSCRVAVRRSRWPRFVLTAAIGLGVGLWLAGIYDSAATARAQWQTEIDGWVVTRDLEAGTTLTTDDLASTRLPTAGTPHDATLTDPNGLMLRDSMATGEIVRDGRLTTATGQLAAQLGEAAGGLTIATDGTPLGAGDLVDLYGLIDGKRLADDARVIEVHEGFATVAIADQQIQAVIQSLTTGGVVPVLVG